MAGREIDFDRPILLGCGRCDVRWTSLEAAHCPTCHETFVSVRGFDLHRYRGACVPPKEAGLIPDGGYWRREGERAPGRLVTIPRQPTRGRRGRPRTSRGQANRR